MEEVFIFMNFKMLKAELGSKRVEGWQATTIIMSLLGLEGILLVTLMFRID
jgi:hypothetical protein